MEEEGGEIRGIRGTKMEEEGGEIQRFFQSRVFSIEGFLELGVPSDSSGQSKRNVDFRKL